MQISARSNAPAACHNFELDPGENKDGESLSHVRTFDMSFEAKLGHHRFQSAIHAATAYTAHEEEPKLQFSVIVDCRHKFHL